MKKVFLLLFCFGAVALKGQTNAQVSFVTIVPSGACPTRSNLRVLVPTGILYTCQSNVWAVASLAPGGGGAITGLTSGTLPKASSSTTLNNSNLLQNADGSLTPSKALDIPIPSNPTFNAAGTTTCDFSLSNACEPGTMTGATTLAVTNTHGIGPYYLIWTQDATGGRVPTYPGAFNATVCPPSTTPNITTFIQIVFNVIGSTYDGLTCTSNDAPTAIIGSERTAITSTTSGLGTLTFDSGTHTTSYYANNSANKHIMPRTVGATDQLSCADLAGGCGALSGTTGSIGGGVLLAGACTSGTVAVTSSTTTMVAIADPNTYPGDGVMWDAQVTVNGTVTVKVCAIVGLTPTASTYNVRVIQ